MIRNYFLITFRGMMKNKVFIIINVFGMGIAIACAIVAYLAYQYDATFDAVHQNKESIYRISAVREFENKETRFGLAPLPLGEVVDKTFQDVNRSTRYLSSWSNFKRDDELFAANLIYVDPDFFQLFSWEFIAGNPADLHDKTTIFVSEVMAVRLFGSPQEAFGKTITQVYGTELKEGKIAGVFREPPPNSSFHKPEGAAYMNFENYKDEHKHVREDDWKVECALFVQIDDASRVSSVAQQLQPYIENNNKVREDFQISKFVLDPLPTMAHRDLDDEVRTWTWGAAPKSAVAGSVVMATLLLLIACFNLTNTAIAISSRRLKEIGIRKVMGSMRMQLIIQFIGETTFICFLALLFALGVTDSLISGWNMLTGNLIQLPHQYLSSPSILIFLGSVLLLTGLIAGSYPAFYISKFEPVNILKGKLKFGGTNYFTRVLLGLQFAFSLIAIVMAVGFFQNANYQREYDLGFDIRGSIVVPVNDKGEYDTYRNSLLANPEILETAGAKSGIFSNRSHEAVKHESKQVEVDVIEVGDNYLNTMDLELVSGRDFIRDSETDLRESIIITQKMADLFAWEKPLGKEIIWKDSVKLFVVGVVKDVYTMGLWREMEPMMIRYVSPEQYTQLVASAKAANVSAVNASMKEQWNTVFPSRLYPGRMLGSELQEVINLNLTLTYMYGFLGVIALVLSATGLFTLVSLNIMKRMKEIGVRKILGASVSNISRIVNMEFIIILSAASLLGAWASYNMATPIMSSIWKYYQGVNLVTFITSIGVLFTVSFITIGYKVLSISTMNPVKTLRDE